MVHNAWFSCIILQFAIAWLLLPHFGSKYLWFLLMNFLCFALFLWAFMVCHALFGFLLPNFPFHNNFGLLWPCFCLTCLIWLLHYNTILPYLLCFVSSRSKGLVFLYDKSDSFYLIFLLISHFPIKITMKLRYIIIFITMFYTGLVFNIVSF